MERFLAFPLEQIPLVAAVLLIAFTVHEFAHAFTAYKFGDPTAKDQGRLTLNPMHHLDPIGTLLIFIAGFGWARPVPVNRYHFKNPRLAGIFVSLMGPISNFALAVLGTAILFILMVTGVAGQLPIFVTQFFSLFVWINVMLFVLNLLPVPPLDGYRIIEDLVSPSLRAKMTQYEQYGSLIFLILVITPLSHYTIRPILNTVVPFFVDSIQSVFVMFLG
ncbi:site-2 protease family protein [Siminovitchia fortis]|uniref:Site-2 protease family protein n=1 Tax=Siminovitchia fortis TaxID=254758 RepID=A0A443IWH0_9BACI|nr:site-2 protease family protein [Siminovitchia fortis]RWR12493.1 site-2 protease family protein [Siminovitchia fortis]WHY81667.1 site-2 protease family protein [Siminovitchia fortis]